MDTATNARIAELESASTIMLGRLNGLVSLVAVMARHLSPDIARKCADDATNVLVHIDATLVASPHPDAMAAEMLRVFNEGINLFEMSAGSR